MGVYIKGMEMPTSCSVCWALDDYGDYPRCRITEEQRGYTFPIREKRMDNCPLVPVPTPHGRLGDLDEINEKHDKLSRDFCHGYFKNTWDFVCAARKIFYDAPTIIPAEEGEA